MGLESIEVDDVEEMVTIFLQVLAHNAKNYEIQKEFVWSGEIISLNFNIVLMVVLHLHDELLAKL
uniref:DUF8040 domain-containing protein n=1 Tax=Cucumis melo TaxID=3656 RepID=A0A9I9DTA7_CUCME